MSEVSGVSKLELINFRSYKKRAFELGRSTLIKGENGAGKSNLMEAIYLLATGKSFRADRDEEMIRYGDKFFRIMGQIGQMGQLSEIGVVMTEGRKHFEVNGVAKRMIDFAGRLTAVLFGPQDLELVTGSPGGRRRYLDFVIGQKDREYRRSLISYEKGLRQRNKLLDMIRDGLAQRHQLYFWDRLLIKDGNYLTDKRGEYLQGLEDSVHNAIYDKSVISELRLKQYEREEVAAGTTLVGPHRDNFQVKIGDRDVSKYGSRGEQRMAVLWLKMGEIKFLTADNLPPILLLDDIFSELDEKHRKEVEKMAEDLLEKGGQVIMTTAEYKISFSKKDWDIIQL